MIPIRLHIITNNDAFEETICINVSMFAVPRIGEQIGFTPEQFAVLEKAADNYTRDGEEVNVDDSYIVEHIRHNLEEDIIQVALGVGE